MKNFMENDFLLSSEFADVLYHEYAANEPIIDYHNHLPPSYIANDRNFSNISEAWLEGDHYKWRAMRANGIKEEFITGSGSAREKFLKWAETVPYTARNPLYHWTHLELRRYFGINELLKPKNANHIFDLTSEQLQSSDKSCKGLLKMMKVETLCTTDDPCDDLQYHLQIAKSDFSVKVLPTFRPDRVLQVQYSRAFRIYVDQLIAASGISIYKLDDLFSALQNRVDFFHDAGCRLSDLGISVLPLIVDDSKVDTYFLKALEGHDLTKNESDALQAVILLELFKMYHAKRWTQQLHLGALRNTNERAAREPGPDTGFDSIGDYNHAKPLATFLSKLDNSNQLGRTILYNVNPRDNDLFASMIGNFQDGEIAGKIQFGSGWWFMDQKSGMENQLNSLSNMGLLSRFIGMLTDSRSFLSFPRHEYFRRILCDLIGQDVVKGELPNDIPWLGEMVRDICYRNAKEYLRL